LGFERGSNLNSIGDRAFALCEQLQLIIIPASVTYLTHKSFLYSRLYDLSAISIEEGNVNFRIAGDGIVDINDVRT
jgi:hypothetical protein